MKVFIALALLAFSLPAQIAIPNRPIASLNATSRHRPVYPGNPRGWTVTGDASKVDVTTPAGIAIFQAALLRWADFAVAEMTRVGAQGAVLWDLEGQEFDTAYIGDPSQIETIAPELVGVLDRFVAKFTDAGFRIGFTLRPQVFDLATASHRNLPDPEPELIRKVRYAHDRWNATLFYIDSTIALDGTVTPASIFEHLLALYPDVICFPEWKTVRDYAYSIPFNPGTRVRGPDQQVLDVYPEASELINVTDQTALAFASELRLAVVKGHLLMWSGWYRHAAGDLIQQIYAALP